MSRALKAKAGVGRREGWAGAADHRGRGCCAGAGWGGGCGFWVCEAEAHETAQRPRTQVAGAQDPGGPWRTWTSSGDGGLHGPGGPAGTDRCACILAQHYTCRGNLADTAQCAEPDLCSCTERD